MLPRDWISVLTSAKRAVFMPDIFQIISDEPFSQHKIAMGRTPQQDMYIYEKFFNIKFSPKQYEIIEFLRRLDNVFSIQCTTPGAL